MEALIDGEVWVDALGYEGLYQVSSLGRLKSLDREEIVRSKRTGGHFRTRKGRILSLTTNKFGYQQVGLYKDGRVKLCLVHRVVFCSFHKQETVEEINHIDGVKDNNNLSNLESSTRTENSRHSVSILGKNRGEGVGTSKLKSQQVLTILAQLSEGISQTNIAKEYGVTNHTIHKIHKKRNWGWLSSPEEGGVNVTK